MKPHRLLFAAALLACLFLGVLRAAEALPPAPDRHFNDYARVVRPDTARELDARLAAFERETSNQILVVLYPRLAAASSVEDYTVRVAQAWGAGTAKQDNGAVLFAFMEQRQLYLQIGYGLEGALPDALAKRIIEDEIIPHMRRGDPDAAFRAGVEAILAATRGEYRGSGRTAAEGAPRGAPQGGGGFMLFIILVVIALSISQQRRGAHVYGPRGRRGLWVGPGPFLGGGRGGGGFGGFGGGGGGGFSGGGGGFGGGGAGGRW